MQGSVLAEGVVLLTYAAVAAERRARGLPHGSGTTLGLPGGWPITNRHLPSSECVDGREPVGGGPGGVGPLAWASSCWASRVRRNSMLVWKKLELGGRSAI